MSIVFCYLALLNGRDAFHQRSAFIALTIAGSRFWTTDLVLTEIANALAFPPARVKAAEYLRHLQQSPDTTIVP